MKIAAAALRNIQDQFGTSPLPSLFFLLSPLPKSAGISKTPTGWWIQGGKGASLPGWTASQEEGSLFAGMPFSMGFPTQDTIYIPRQN